MTQHARELRVTPEEARAFEDLLARLAGVAVLEPALASAEIRPLVESLEARRRRCTACGVPFLAKQNHVRERAYCAPTCRVRDLRKSGERNQKTVDATEPQPVA